MEWFDNNHYVIPTGFTKFSPLASSEYFNAQIIIFIVKGVTLKFLIGLNK